MSKKDKALKKLRALPTFPVSLLATAKGPGHVSAIDVAAYILQELGMMTPIKFHRLVYYSQAWSLVWDDMPLFDDRIEAWANGPIVPVLYERHSGCFSVQPDLFSDGDVDAISESQRETIDAVLYYYGDRTSQWLTDLTRHEEPWRSARVGIGAWMRVGREITHASMAEYYSAIAKASSTVVEL
jgi:uncharacterized phage-associated protein